MVGQTISHYMVVERLGGGGMGEVYKALDQRLDRHVALKFLPPGMTHDVHARERFMREAKAASALDHPNICTIHEIDTIQDGQLFIAMSYYDGETIKKKIERQDLTVDLAIDFARQIAQGLVLAHEAGILHRDIKPANAMVTRDNLVKIVDFGLAKLTGLTDLTHSGIAMGTMGYMSPEQLRGKDIDARTDIWALGVMLYEMASYRHPFQGEYRDARMYAVMHVDPDPLTQHCPEAPPELERIVHRALEKQPEKRYQTMAEFLSDISQLQKVTESQMPTVTMLPAGSHPHKKRSVRTLIGITAPIVLLAGILAYMLLQGENRAVSPRFGHTRQVTSAPGLEDHASWSPDGTRIAYTSDENGNLDIYVRQVSGGQAINITASHSGIDQRPSWSPDGTRIAFISQRGTRWGVYVMPALGGGATMVAETSDFGHFSTPSWSPDGSHFVFARGDVTTSHIYTVPAGGGEPARITPEEDAGWQGQPSWSPDGKWIVYVRMLGWESSSSELWMIPSEGGDRVRLTEGGAREENPIWAYDGRSIWFLSNRGGSPDIWWLPVDPDNRSTGQPEQMTVGIGVGSLYPSGDNSQIAYSKAISRRNIWAMPISESGTSGFQEIRALTSTNNAIEYIDISPDGSTLAFNSNRSGNHDLWTVSSKGGEAVQLTTQDVQEWGPDWSPDGNKIVFYGNQEGNREIYAIPSEGGIPVRLTNHEAEDFCADWSPDGSRLVFNSTRSGNVDVFVMSATGDQIRRLTTDERTDTFPKWSPDGRSIAFISTRSGVHQVWRMSMQTGEKTMVTRDGGAFVCWSPDGRSLYYTARTNAIYNIWEIPAEGGEARQLTFFENPSRQTGRLGLVAHAGQLFFTLDESIGDIWVMDIETDTN